MSSLMQRQANYYDVLNVSQDATMKEIKSAYKRLVLVFHPDVSSNEENINKFKDIVKAYTVLKDEEQREEYNKQLRKNEGFFPKIKFNYYYSELLKKKDDFLNKFKILFKNVSGDQALLKKFDDEYLQNKAKITQEILDMPIEELEQRLQYSSNLFVKTASAIAIGYKNEKRSINILENAILDQNLEVKKAVIWAIGNLKMKKSLSFLKILYNSTYSLLKLDILKAIYKITEGKGLFFYNMLIKGMVDEIDEVKKGAFELLLVTDKKINFNEIKYAVKSASPEIKMLFDKLITEKRVIGA